MPKGVSQITGKIAAVEDEYTVLINRGSADGVEVGTIFSIRSKDGGEPVIDPDTKKELGKRAVEKLRVRVVSVEDRFCVAETYKAYSPYEKLLGNAMGPMTKFTLSGERDRIKSRTTLTPTSQQPVVAVVNVGDEVKSVHSEL